MVDHTAIPTVLVAWLTGAQGIPAFVGGLGKVIAVVVIAGWFFSVVKRTTG